MKCIITFLSFSIFTITGYSQITGSNTTPAEAQKFDQKLLNTHSQEELQDMFSNYPEDFNILSYYFLSSYQLIITDPNNPNLSLFDMENFNISKYEVIRKLTEETVINFDKYGVQLIITPYNQLEYLTTIQEKLKEELENQ